MVGAIDSEQTLINWVVRLYYVALFIPWMVAYPILSIPFTIPYLMAITILVILGLRIANEQEAFKELDDRYKRRNHLFQLGEELNDMYLEDISGYKHILEN